MIVSGFFSPVVTKIAIEQFLIAFGYTAAGMYTISNGRDRYLIQRYSWPHILKHLS